MPSTIGSQTTTWAFYAEMTRTVVAAPVPPPRFELGTYSYGYLV